MRPVILFILLPINNLPAPTVRAERSAVGTCSTEHFRQENRTLSRHMKSMKRSMACLLGYNQQHERSTARSCSVERFGLVEENTVKARSMTIICMPAVVQASQTTPIIGCLWVIQLPVNTSGGGLSIKRTCSRVTCLVASVCVYGCVWCPNTLFFLSLLRLLKKH